MPSKGTGWLEAKLRLSETKLWPEPRSHALGRPQSSGTRSGRVGQAVSLYPLLHAFASDAIMPPSKTSYIGGDLKVGATRCLLLPR